MLKTSVSLAAAMYVAFYGTSVLAHEVAELTIAEAVPVEVAAVIAETEEMFVLPAPDEPATEVTTIIDAVPLAVAEVVEVARPEKEQLTAAESKAIETVDRVFGPLPEAEVAAEPERVAHSFEPVAREPDVAKPEVGLSRWQSFKTFLAETFESQKAEALEEKEGSG